MYNKNKVSTTDISTVIVDKSTVLEVALIINNYYRDLSLKNNDICNDSVPLQLNCVGVETRERPRKANTSRRDYYLFYLREGATKIDLPIDATLRGGDMIIFEPDCHFAFHTVGAETTVHYTAHFTGYLAKNLLRNCGISTNTVYSVGISNKITSNFNSLFGVFVRRDEFFDLDGAGKFCDLLVTLARCIGDSQKNGALLRRRNLEKSLAYIHTHFTERITLSELAELEFLSESRYRALFTSQFNQSPTEYIINLRMDMACNLLSQSDMSISHIAEKIGYPDVRYFSRLFKQKNYRTPSEYRKSFEGAGI